MPFQTLLDYLKVGDPLSEFLEDFPTVSRTPFSLVRILLNECLPMPHFSPEECRNYFRHCGYPGTTWS